MEYPRTPRASGSTYVDRWRVPIDGFDLQDIDGEAWLVVKGASARHYPPLRNPRLVSEFTSIAADPKPSAFLAFANRWGTLQGWQPVAPRGGALGVRFGAQLAGRLGEPIDGWYQEVARLADVVEVWRAARVLKDRISHSPAEAREARVLIASRFRETDGDFAYDGRSGHRWFLRRDSAGYDFVRAARREDRLEKAAQYFVHLLVNEGLRGEVSPAVLPYEGSAIRFWPHSLVGAMYLIVATEVAGQRAAERPCRQCGMPFIPTRSDARYCGTACRSRASYLEGRRTATRSEATSASGHE